MNRYKRMIIRAIDCLFPARRIISVQGDELPAKLPKRDIVLTTEDGEPFLIGMRCPCGCGKRLEMMASTEITPHWKVSVNKRPSNVASLGTSSGWLFVSFLASQRASKMVLIGIQFSHKSSRCPTVSWKATVSKFV